MAGGSGLAGHQLAEALIVVFALALTSADKALALEVAKLGGDDGALVFAVGAVVVKQDPVVGFPQGVGVGGIGEQGGVVPRTAVGVQHGEPGLARGIETERGDSLQPIGGGGRAILVVNVEKFRHWRLGGAGRRSGRRSGAAEAMREGIADAGEALGAETAEDFEAAIVGRRLQVGQRFEAQIIVELSGKGAADARHRTEQQEGVVFAAQAVEHGQPPVQEQIANRAGNALADAGQGLQPREAVPREDFGDGLGESADGGGGVAIGFDAETIRPLLGQNGGHLLEAAGDIVIEGDSHGGGGLAGDERSPRSLLRGTLRRKSESAAHLLAEIGRLLAAVGRGGKRDRGGGLAAAVNQKGARIHKICGAGAARKEYQGAGYSSTTMQTDRSVAYFSMEIAVDPAMPTYAGGLGVLAGDTLRSCADLGVPILAVTLLHRKGYLTQSFDATGWQRERQADWNVEQYLTELPQRAVVMIEERTVTVRAWRYEFTGISGGTVPVFFLDSDLPENSAWDRTLTHFLYGGDAYYRICQEAILGIGGVRMIRALGYDNLQRFHMNEGHASLLTLELLDEDARRNGRQTINGADIDAVKARCIFTTHTPVAAGHDQFAMDLVGRIFSRRHGFLDARDVFCADLVRRVVKMEEPNGDLGGIFVRQNTLNLTHLALALSHYVNGVAMRHAEVSRRLFGKYQVDAISNGVHAATWTAPSLQRLFDGHIPGWRVDNFSLRYASSIPAHELWDAHLAAKEEFFAFVRESAHVELDPQVLTLGFARRSTPYKRAELLLTDPGRLESIVARGGRLQVVFGGKAHPNDYGGKEIIQRILRLRDTLRAMSLTRIDPPLLS